MDWTAVGAHSAASMLADCCSSLLMLMLMLLWNLGPCAPRDSVCASARPDHAFDARVDDDDNEQQQQI
eukprot:765557-Rhodomonas_salina.1